MILYVSGPMTGCPDWNFPTFNDAARRLRDAGYDVINPAENWGGNPGIDRWECMKLDLHQVLTAEGVATLPGWQYSEGAELEVRVAEEIGIPVKSVRTWIRGAA